MSHTQNDVQLRVHIRWMITSDMPQTLTIEQDGHQFPWTEADFVRCLRTRNCIGMIAEAKEESQQGFMIYELHHHRLEIINFAVAVEARRLGVGRQMVDRLISRLSPERRARINVMVRETNLPALQFFQAMGFRAESVVRQPYDETDEDGIEMIYRLKEQRSANDTTIGDVAENYLGK